MSDLPARRPQPAPGPQFPVTVRPVAVRRVLAAPATREAAGVRLLAWARPAVCLPVPPALRSAWSVGSALGAAGAGNVLAILPARVMLALAWAAAMLAVTATAVLALVVVAGRSVREGGR